MSLFPNPDHFARPDRWQEILEAVRLGPDDENCDPAASQILPILETFVHSEEEIETGTLGKRKQGAILLACQACFGHGLTSMVRKRVLEPAGDTLVQQDLHPIGRQEAISPVPGGGVTVLHQAAGNALFLR